jgi:hypothetical protein
VTDNYRVTAPYVTLRSKAEAGGDVVLGYYAGALVPETVDLEDLARLIRKGMVEKLEGPEASAVQKQQAAEAEAARKRQDAPEDKEGVAAVRKAAEAKAKAKADAEKEEAEAAKEGRPLLRATDSKPGSKTATAG